MQINRGLRYVCRDVHMKVENDETPFTSLYPKGSVVKMPIGHMEGNYTAPPETLAQLEREGRVVFRYCDAEGRVVDSANPNGAAERHRRHLQPRGQRRRPDAASGPLLGSRCSATTQGIKMFESAVAALAAR